MSQGIALYKLSGTERLKTFTIPHNERRSRNVAFHDGATTVICGSDHGKVYIFDRRTGKINDTIHIGVKEWVQSIAVGNYMDEDETLLIFFVEHRGSRDSADFDRTIW